MSANFEIKVLRLFTTDIGDLKNVIKKVEFSVKGIDQDQSFELPKYCDLTEPESTSFKQFEELTENDVIVWIEENFEELDSVKAHIQYVLDAEVAKAALTQKNAPWNTVEDNSIITPTAPIVPDAPAVPAIPVA